MRQTGITGSEVGGLVGLSRYLSPIDVYRAKVTPVEDECLADLSPDQIRGHLYEAPTREWYALQEKRHLVPVGTLRHPEHPLIIATPDSLSYADAAHTEDPRVLEVKVPRRHAGRWGEPGTSDIDSAHYPQVLFEMAVTGTAMCDVAVFLHGEVAVYHVPFSQEMYDGLRYVAEKFWRDHIVPQRPPEPDGSEGYEDYLKYQYPCSTQAILEADAHTARNLDALVDVRARIEKMQQEERLLVNTLKLRIGDAAGIASDRVKVTWRANKQGSSTDYRAAVLEAGVAQDIINKHTSPAAPLRPFRVKKINAGS